MEQTPLQKQVVRYGNQSYIGMLICGVLYAIFGGVAIFFGVTYIPETEDDEQGKFRIGIGIFFVIMAGFSIAFSFFGKNLKRAAEERNVGKLKNIFAFWIAMDIVTGSLFLGIILVSGILILLLILLAFVADIWRLRILKRFIEECKTTSSNMTAVCGP